MKKFYVKEFMLFRRLRKQFKKWIINDENFVKHNEYFYVLNSAVVKKKIIKKYHDDSLSKHFEIQKILNLIQKKYHWIICTE